MFSVVNCHGPGLTEAPTGASKTLTVHSGFQFSWCLKKDKMSIVVTPLNLLGRQNKEALDKAGINGVAILLGSKVRHFFLVYFHYLLSYPV